MKSRFQMLLGVSLALALGACSDDKDPVMMNDGGVGVGDGGVDSGPGQPMCPASCPTGQACDPVKTGGQCKPVDGMACPCLPGSHCDLNTNMCVGGCETNSDCKMGDMCNAMTGMCSPGCMGTLVPGLTLSKVVINQGVSIPLAQAGAPVATAMRAAPDIQNRAAVVRVFVTPEPTFMANTNVTAVLKVDNGGTVKQFTAAKAISAASTDNAFDSTLNIEVDAASITATTKYSVELTQDACAATPGTGRFPTSGTQALEATKSARLKVVLVPHEVAPNKLDVSPAAIQSITDHLTALYPVEGVDVTVEPAVPVDAAMTLQKLLQSVRALRAMKNPSPDTYYIGLLTAKPTFREACPTGCVAGIATLGGAGDAGLPEDRYGVVLGYLSETAVMSGGATLTEKQITLNEIARQLGHAHGRQNSPCGTPLPESVDTAFPNTNNAAIDGLGYHIVTKATASPETHKDLMGFCTPSWIHSYTYNLLAKRVKAVAGVPGPYKIPGPAVEYASVLVQGDGEHFWGDNFVLNEQPAGEVVTTRAFDANGNVVDSDVEVTLTQLSEISDVLATLPPPAANWASIEINGRLVPVN